jgi:hypothetical protein
MTSPVGIGLFCGPAAEPGLMSYRRNQLITAYNQNFAYIEKTLL